MEEVTEQEVNDFLAEVAASGMSFDEFIRREFLTSTLRVL